MRRVSMVALLSALLIADEARACSIPVFRFALERWTPASYQVLVLRESQLDSAQLDCLKRLQEAHKTNFRVAEVDDTANVGLRWLNLRAPTPLLALRAPDAESKSPFVWSAPLTSANVDALLESPTRRQTKILQDQWPFLN